MKLTADRVEKLFENDLYKLQKNKLAYLSDKNSKIVKAMERMIEENQKIFDQRLNNVTTELRDEL